MNYGYLEQLKDILPGIILAVVMGCGIYPIQWIVLPDILILLIQAIVGSAIYIGLSFLFKVESLKYLLSMLKRNR